METRWNAISIDGKEEPFVDAGGKIFFDPACGVVVGRDGNVRTHNYKVMTCWPLRTTAALPDDPTAARQATEGERRTTPALTKDHEMILAILAKTPHRCQRVIDVAANGPIRNRETVGRLLKELEDMGLVERKFGKRKGYASTAEGLERAKAVT